MLQIWIRSVIVVVVFLGTGQPGYGQGIFSCRDTQFSSDATPNLVRSKYHLVQIFGDVSYRKSNFFASNYEGSVGWTEHRLFVPRFSEFVDTPVPLPDPFITGLLKRLRDIDWEERWDYGIGLEWRPFKKSKIVDIPGAGWLGHIRGYAVYLQTAYLQYRESWSWRPADDLRMGWELYRECNLYGDAETTILWSEFWMDGSWRSTNFFVEDFASWTFTFVPRIGIKLFPAKSMALMPYVTGELALTGRSEFWQNRAIAGAGLRMMPFRDVTGAAGDLLKGTRLYAEALWIAQYFARTPPSSVPTRDLRGGVTFTINRW